MAILIMSFVRACAWAQVRLAPKAQAAPAVDRRLRRFGVLIAKLRMVLGVACLVCFGLKGAVLGQVSREYDLKAVFLFNFAQFVEWPARAFPTAEAPFVVGIIGNDPFKGALDDVVRNEK